MSRGDDIGDRMKAYESVETDRRFNHTMPVYARIDGRGFSKFTRNMRRPFDPLMTGSMVDTTRYLVDKTHAIIGYVQSDEISLVWDGDNENNSLFFAGKVQKTCSVLASMTAARFAVAYYDWFGELSQDYPHFDCRVIQMPDRTEATNMLLWRAMDARKNAVSMAARHEFSHRDLQGRSTAEMIGMLVSKGISMNDYPKAFTRGTWLRRSSEQRTLTTAELAAIPEKHRPSPDMTVTRSAVVELDMPWFLDVANRDAVVFDQAAPLA